MSDEEWEIRMAEVKQKRGIISKGHRNDPIQKGFMPDEVDKSPSVSGSVKKGRTGRKSFNEWFKTLSRRKPD